MILDGVRHHLRRNNEREILLTKKKRFLLLTRKIMMFLFVNHVDIFVVKGMKLYAEEKLNRKADLLILKKPIKRT